MTHDKNNTDEDLVQLLHALSMMLENEQITEARAYVREQIAKYRSVSGIDAVQRIIDDEYPRPRPERTGA